MDISQLDTNPQLIGEIATLTAPPEEAKPELTHAQIIAEATNDPALSKDQFVLGGRTFTVVSLGYRQYLQFISKLEPILKAVAGKVKESMNLPTGDANKVHIPGLILTSLSDIDAGHLLHFCLNELPSMTEIVCNMEAIAAKKDSDVITAEWVEDHAENPFELIDIVLRQVNKNKMIVQFASFFAQILPMFQGKKTAPLAK